MTPSEEPNNQAARILEQVAELLSEERLGQMIDGPIDQAVGEFQCGDGDGSNHFLHHIIASFIQRLYGRMPGFGRRLSIPAAHDEAIALLSHLYQGTRVGGYDGAIADAVDPSGTGIHLVLHNLTEALGAHHRYIYNRWVVARHIECADWPTRCEMAAILLARCRQSLPPHLQSLPAEWFATSVFDLLALDLTTSRQVLQPTTGAPVQVP
jgi:hypothetical protein